MLVDNVENISNPSGVKQIRMLVNAYRVISITLNYSVYKTGKGYHINKLFEVLSKDVNHTFNAFLELHELGLNEKIKQNEFLYRLRKLWDSEEYQRFSDSEYLEIVKETYKLDPEFFMTSIYPKMVSWKFPSFLSVNDEVITLVDKLSKEFVLSKPEQDET